MAKRKRLTPARPDYLEDNRPAPGLNPMFPAETPRAAPPVAQVAGATAAQAALEELSGELRAARAEGRLVQDLPLDAIEETYLVRDRMTADDADMEALKESLKARGQQTPIEVVELTEGRYGLISGWRRLAALRALKQDTGEACFETVRAFLRQPQSASDAYVAMVEENEIRVGLSYYERARIVARAAEQGVYPDEAAALRGLFASASRAKRSKIGSFIAIYNALDDHLRFASAIPERLGLSIAKVLKDDPKTVSAFLKTLDRAGAETSEAELSALTKAVSSSSSDRGNSAVSESDATPKETIGTIQLKPNRNGTQITLSGRGISEAFLADLRVWLQSRDG
ncbi:MULTISPECIES: ParB N-terminal domain-containing protein [unclassified Ruegeria]|uniref:ParB/RepB/Spo0J family partition protein n=1 Tax=unclassified Ruegeria TaxID=2625375 RepID=UPI0014882431|nr:MULTISPECIES: ParB N-terminal domain-containing protein [unclassified Ruegeria]NOD65544.1 ParB N-terminal domain-containing protein [Ruegeria sp. HKCCD6109]